MLLLLSLAYAADAPCYGHDFENRSESAHFWVEWPDGVVPLGGAQVVLQAAEDARTAYKRDLDYRITEEPVVIFVQDLGGSGVSGITQTRDCGGRPVPSVTLHVASWDDADVAEVTAHEIAHVVQYAYMGSYGDSVASWLWWMEGHATWLTPQSTGRWKPWSDTAQDYLDRAALPLHHDVMGFLDPDASAHMYGTTFLVEGLAAWAGEDKVREIWQWGADHSGELVFFPDAIAGVGLEFDAFWADQLARLPTLDVSRPERLTAPAPVEVAAALPAAGTSAGPAGLGVELIHLPAALGAQRRALEVVFDGDPAAPWHVVLARTRDGALLDYVPLPVTDGHAEGTLADFHGVDGWLIASPHAAGSDPLPYRWSADLVANTAPMDGTVVVVEQPGGCVHAAVNRTFPIGLSLVALLGRRGQKKRSRPA